jgi:hypothetical protein
MQIVYDDSVYKVSKDSGGTSRRNYVIVWRDSTDDFITNGTFDSDLSGWIENTAPAEVSWVASEGGFTGAAKIASTQDEVGVLQRIDPFFAGVFRLQADINVTSLSGCEVAIYSASFGGVIKSVSTTGLVEIDTVLRKNSGAFLGILIYQRGDGTSTFYVDNVSVTPIADSIAGKVYNLTITEANDSVWYKHKGGVWWYDRAHTVNILETAVDSFFTPDYYDVTPDAFAFTDITNAELNTLYTSDSIIVSGITQAIDISITPIISEYRIGLNGSWTSASGSVDNGDTVWVRHTSFNEYSSTNHTLLFLGVIGFVVDTFSVTTKAEPVSGNEPYMITAEGDTMFTADGDTMRIGFMQFDILEQIKNGEKDEEDFILPQCVYAYLNSKRTMELNS